MAKLLLINPPIRRYDTWDLAPPLGLLMLAWNARRSGREVELLDLNLPEMLSLGDSPANFYREVDTLISNSGANEIGITSMGINSHVSIEIARRAERSGAKAVLGGVHLASVSREVSEAFGLMNVVTPVRQRTESGEWWAIPPDLLTAADPPSVEELFKAVDLRRYREGGSRCVANFSVGVGCKYKCAFCYSPFQYGSHSRLPVPVAASRLVELSELGFKEVFLVEDNLLNDRLWFDELCAELSRVAVKGLRWYGYATLPELNAERLVLAGNAGCVGLYIGADSADPMQQRDWNKRFVRSLEQVSDIVKAACDAGIVPTIAFILDLAPGAVDSVGRVMDFAQRLAVLGADIRLSVLTVYPKSGLGRRPVNNGEMVYSEEKARVLMDVPMAVVENAFAREYPAMFPWHCRPAGILDWSTRVLAVATAQHMLNFGAENVAAAELSGHELWTVFYETARRLEEADFSVHKSHLQDHLRETALAVLGRGRL